MRFKKIYIEITNKCNFNCPFCSKRILPEKEMSLEEFEHILKEIKPFTKYIYLHVKGEPLFHSKFEDIVKLCEEYNFEVNITTNGSLLEQRKEILKSKCVRQINISLQSYSNIGFVKNIVGVCDELAKNTYIIYRFWALDNNKMSLDNQNIINYLYEHYDSCDDHLGDNIYISKNQLFEWPNIESNEYSDEYCLGTKSHVAILAGGQVVPCCLDADANALLGNIFEKKFESIITSKRFIEMNNGFKNNKCTETLCKHCTYKNRFKK